MVAMRKYSGVKTMQIVGEIRYADAKSKGVQDSSMTDGAVSYTHLAVKSDAVSQIQVLQAESSVAEGLSLIHI